MSAEVNSFMSSPHLLLSSDALYSRMALRIDLYVSFSRSPAKGVAPSPKVFSNNYMMTLNFSSDNSPPRAIPLSLKTRMENWSELSFKSSSNFAKPLSFATSAFVERAF